MEQQHISTVQDTYTSINKHADTFAECFYDNLEMIDPDLHSRFTSNLKVSGKQLIDALGVVVDGLSDIDSILPAVKAVTQKHAQITFTNNDFITIGDALMETIEDGFGDDCTDDIRDAWEAAVLVVVKGMK